MRFMHISDLHLGRQLHRYSLQEEQDEILEHIRVMAAAERPDAALIAGDVYDRSIPPVYAALSLERFLEGLLATGARVMMCSGNHDSAERVGFLSGALQKSGLHVSPAYRGEVRPVVLEDDAGPVAFWMLPFLKPSAVRPFFPEENIQTTHDAVACALRQMSLQPGQRNVLVCHQFVSGGSIIGSEEACNPTGDVVVGGSDLVDASLFADFDYVALGHLHHPQNVGSPRIRYCGTPLKYSFSELNSAKSVTMVDLSGDGSLTVRELPLPEPRRLQELRGSFDDLTSEEALARADRDAYTHIILTAEHPIPEVMSRLRVCYPRITHLDWDNTRTRSADDFAAPGAAPSAVPFELFSEFFERANGAAMSETQAEYLRSVISSIWEVDA